MKNFAFVLMMFVFIFNLNSMLNAQVISKEKIKKLNEIGTILDRAIIEGDYETIIEYYTKDVIIMPGFSPSVKGIDALQKAYDKNKKDGLKYHSFTATAEKRWMCGNEIFEYGTFGMAVSSKNSPKPKAYYGSYFQIWQEFDDGSFKLKYTIWNLDFNPFDYD